MEGDDPAFAPRITTSRITTSAARNQEPAEVKKHDQQQQPEVYYTARHLLHALSQLSEHQLDLPLVLIHGKDLAKPNLIHGLIPDPVPVDRHTVEEKKPALLALASLG